MSDNTMKAFVLTGHGDFDKLEYHTDWSKPEPKAGEVLIRVNACGLNNTDVNTRTAWYSKGVSDATTGEAFDGANDEDGTWGGAAVTFPRIQGADVAGRVEVVGEGVDAGLIGKRVLVDPWQRDWSDPLNTDKTGYFGSECDGGFAEYTTVHQNNVHPVDCDFSDAELATFATAYVTAENMLNRANVAEGDTVLISGASGGVGSGLIQLAKRRGATTIAMCSDSKAEGVRAVGADYVIGRSMDNLKAVLRETTGKNSVSVVADVVGGEMWSQLIDVLERRGRYTCAGAIGGPMVDFDLRTFYLRDLTFTGATVVPPGVFADLAGYVERGEVKPLLAKTFPLDQLHDAQRLFIDKQHIGNVVVLID